MKYWLTINEAAMYCNLAGGMGLVPPGKINTTEDNNNCLHNLILGHAKAYRRYRDNHYPKYKGTTTLVTAGPLRCAMISVLCRALRP